MTETVEIEVTEDDLQNIYEGLNLEHYVHEYDQTVRLTRYPQDLGDGKKCILAGTTFDTLKRGQPVRWNTAYDQFEVEVTLSEGNPLTRDADLTMTEHLFLDGEEIPYTLAGLADATGITENRLYEFFHGEKEPHSVDMEAIDRAVYGDTVATRAAEILNDLSESTTYEANRSTCDDEQYVDVFEDPHESAGMTESLRSEHFERLRDEGIHFNGCFINWRPETLEPRPDHRYWFTEIDQ